MPTNPNPENVPDPNQATIDAIAAKMAEAAAEAARKAAEAASQATEKK
ncbi:hypothetical protein [Ktedonobacter robiniae]|uniref:Uncharacterized protein n=1 Tax=Ktedonobacter robiniae TaxID=2778365 RepID=A0ABQ3UUV8_9CHLR|nr:hypothetical protein [Ktedonobacter robiniae]GHO56476.1 hypothetical protein KSB_49510 [Ktedonobacter robiniae]